MGFIHYLGTSRAKNIQTVGCVSAIEPNYTQKLLILTHPTQPLILDNLFFGVPLLLKDSWSRGFKLQLN
ncbi:MAG: hypothetical protein ACRAVC_02275 [Trichormus sp.]